MYSIKIHSQILIHTQISNLIHNSEGSIKVESRQPPR